MLFPKFGEEIETKNKIMIQLGIGTELFSISSLDLYIVGKIGTSLDKGADNINIAGCMLTFEF